VAEIAGSVLVSLGLDVDEFNTGLQQAQKLASTAGKSISDKLDARRATLSALQQQLNQLETKLKSNPWSAAALEAPIKALQAEIALRKESIALLEKQIKTQGQLRQKPEGSGAEFVSGAIGALPGIGGLASLGPAAAGAGVAAAGVAAVKAANDFQKLNQQLNLLTGSTIDTQNALRELKEYAAKTPFDLPGVAENTKLLLAFGLSTQQAVDFTKRLGDIATVTGTPLDRLALNLGQIVSLGKAFTVDLRQFAIAGVPIYESLSAVTGKTVEQLKGLGSIPADDVIKAFRLMTEEGGKFYQGGEKGGTKLDATLATLGESLTMLGVTVGKILGPTVLETIDSANQSVTSIGKRLDELSQISQIPALKQITDFVNKFGPAFALKLLTGTYAFDLADGVQGATGGRPPAPTPVPGSDPASVLRQQQKETEKLAALAVQAAKDREEAEYKIVEPARKRLRIAELSSVLSGRDLETAKQALDLDTLRTEELRAQKAYRDALKDAGGNTDDKGVIEAGKTLEAASMAVRENLTLGAKSMSDAAADSTLFIGQFKLQAQVLEERIAKAKQLAGIEDQAQRAQVAAAQSVLESVNQARQKQIDLFLQLKNQAATGASSDAIRETAKQITLASKDLELAGINAGRALKDQLNEATKRLNDTLSSNFAILTQIGKQRVLEQAQQNITRGVQTGLVDPTLIPSQSNAQAFIAFGQQAAAIADAVGSFNVTQRSVADAQAQLAQDFANTGTLVTKSIGNLADSAIPNLVAALNANALADRTITVTVNADTGQTFINQAAALP
jgi:hypothetical protein